LLAILKLPRHTSRHTSRLKIDLSFIVTEKINLEMCLVFDFLDTFVWLFDFLDWLLDFLDWKKIASKLKCLPCGSFVSNHGENLWALIGLHCGLRAICVGCAPVYLKAEPTTQSAVGHFFTFLILFLFTGFLHQQKMGARFCHSDADLSATVLYFAGLFLPLFQDLHPRWYAVKQKRPPTPCSIKH
jgi:hypothetical protein